MIYKERKMESNSYFDKQSERQRGKNRGTYRQIKTGKHMDRYSIQGQTKAGRPTTIKTYNLKQISSQKRQAGG